MVAKYQREAARRLRMEVNVLDKYTKGLRILARRNDLTDADWFNLLEKRQALLKPHLREMTLKSLGDLKIVHDDRTGSSAYFGRTLQMGGLAIVPNRHSDSHRDPCEPKEVSVDFPLNTHGIFPDDEVYYHGHFKSEFIYPPEGQEPTIGLVIRFWGLTRNNKWIKIEVPIKYLTQPRDPGYDETPERMSEVERVIVHQSNPSEICHFCGVTPRWIWQRLGDVVQEWVKHRRSLLSNVERLVEVVKLEEVMLGIVTPK